MGEDVPPWGAGGPASGQPAPCLPLLARYGRQALAVQIQRRWKKWSRQAPPADAAVAADLEAAAADGVARRLSCDT
eukprot:5815794-Alexandrium_andersonii.AAC.1